MKVLDVAFELVWRVTLRVYGDEDYARIRTIGRVRETLIESLGFGQGEGTDIWAMRITEKEQAPMTLELRLRELVTVLVLQLKRRQMLRPIRQ